MCGDPKTELPELTHSQWPKVKEKCKKAGIHEYIDDPELRNAIYRTVGTQKTVEELKVMFQSHPNSSCCNNDSEGVDFPGSMTA